MMCETRLAEENVFALTFREKAMRYQLSVLESD
jgi:hypothetical protein